MSGRPTSTTRKKRTSTTRIEPGPAVLALALGGNVPGNLPGKAGGGPSPVEHTLAWALRRLEASLGPLRVASLYRTAPVSPVPQPDFLNTAALGHTDLPPEGVLALGKALEREAGRRPGERFGPRPLDIDILLYGGLVLEGPELTLPHPRMRERRFVLAPLAEIAPDLAVPPDGARVADLLARLGEGERVERVEWSGFP
ncbi:MAG TPA: 2-amino-4-hydroxy-6-hydroxymethyldihydropteridine diphosphokinase [Thermoanaerobaculia bacterium]|nr:2-amino-4-hydroxy-6-hydroxymethyldihydropteridine diphosphokinase [Thermoanaerobaculia bacterium]